MQTGWQQISGEWYYFVGGDSGRMLTGWQKISGAWYYFADGDSGQMQKGWQKISGAWYYFAGGDSGRMQTGWQQISGEWYYFAGGDSGRMLTGWQKISGAWYYLAGGDSGRMLTGTQYVDGRYYYFNVSGHLVSMNGIDVSRYQGDIDWKKVKAAGIDFAIIKIGYIGNVDNVVDVNFVKNVKAAKAAGVAVGGYIYVYSGNTTAMNNGIDIMRSAVASAGVSMDLPIYLDIEDPLFLSNTGGETSTGNALRTSLVAGGMQRLKDYGYNSGIYTNPTWSKYYIDTVQLQQAGWSLWLAQWPYANSYVAVDPHSYSWFGSIPPTVWQYSSKGTVNGISGHVDMDYWIY
jgi:GH25 family lysozyme M1 (1,4-beta-N-acetylmuramidase)